MPSPGPQGTAGPPSSTVMPIRFRCAYCNQLLGIARRKAGTVVRCPTCAGQVVVPATDGAEPSVNAGDEPPLFERNDFDELFELPAGPDVRGGEAAAAAAAPPAGAWGTHADRDQELQPLGVPRGEAAGFGPMERPPGIVLSPVLATVLAVVVVVLLAVAFGAGVLVGQLL